MYTRAKVARVSKVPCQLYRLHIFNEVDGIYSIMRDGGGVEEKTRRERGWKSDNFSRSYIEGNEG